ncbi:MAG TPA: hypothetical protein VFX33_00475 [Actinomycetales bacterium]|jgi:hypothetical protein|nr:hypothetical protein [Actinomycetales bacterium]
MSAAGVAVVFGLAGLVVLAGLVTALGVLLANRRDGRGSGATGLPTAPGSPDGTANGAATGASHTSGDL